MIATGSGDHDRARLDPTAGNDYSVRLWDTATARQLQKLTGHSDEVLSVSFSPDGNGVLSGGADRIYVLWDRVTGQEIARTPQQTGRIQCTQFSPDGQQIITGTDDGVISLWDSRLKYLDRFGKNTGNVSSVSFSPDGLQLVSAHDDVLIERRMRGLGEEIRRTFKECAVRVWNVGTRQMTFEDQWQDFGANGVQFSPTGDRIAAMVSNNITVWSLADAGPKKVYGLRWGSRTCALHFQSDKIDTLNGGGFSSSIWHEHVTVTGK